MFLAALVARKMEHDMNGPDLPAVSRRTLLAGAGLSASFGLLPTFARAAAPANAAGNPHMDFPLISGGKPATVHVDEGADTAVKLVAAAFTQDLERVSGIRPTLTEGHVADLRGPLVIIGVLGQSSIIDGLVQAGKIDAADLKGEWEAFRQIVVEHPLPGISRALVIVGADRRGAVFGTYDMSIGVQKGPPIGVQKGPL
ncbi:hypothetical protein [Sphingomonas oryzagri]